MKRALFLSLLVAAPALASDVLITPAATRPPSPTLVERLARLCEDHHAVPAAAVLALEEDDVRALVALARDPSRPLFVRGRATALAGARPTPVVEALWDELLAGPEGQLRVQAAWARGLARRGAQRSRWAQALLDDKDERLREAGAHLLFLGPEPEAKARRRLRSEPAGVVRAVLERKLASRSATRGGR
jgi:hypothetical protein